MTALFFTLVLGSFPTPRDVEAAYHRGLDARDDAAVARRHFREAASAFDEQWQEEKSPALAQHRGQAWHLAGDIGRSIAAYRDGLRLFPDDDGLLTRLEFTRGQVILPRDGELADASRPIPPPRPPVAVSPQAIFAVVLLFNLAGGIALARWRLTRSPGTLAAGLMCFLGSWASAWAWHEANKQAARHWAEPVVVVTAPAVMRAGNNAEFPARFPQPIPAGVEVTPLDERGGWVRVRLPGGQMGWLPGDAMTR